MTTTAEQSAAPTRLAGELRALTGLRIVAAAWVVLFHFHFTALPGVAVVTALLGPLVTAGALGVDLFFVLSGFVIAYTYLEQLGPRLSGAASARFVWARACRIWPAYALVLHMFGIWLVARAVYGTDPDIAFQAVQPVLSPGEWLQQVFLVQLWGNPMFDGTSWVGSTWSISAEWLAYLLFPPAAVVLYRLRNLPFAVLAAGAMALMTPIAMSYVETGSPYHPWSWLVRILCGFGGGVLTYLAVRKLRAERVAGAASAVASATPVLIVAGLLAGELAGPGRGGAVIVLFPVLVGSLALADRGVARWLSRPAMVHGGRISYGLYLIHIPMFEVFWLALRRLGGYEGSTLLVADGVVAHVVGLVVLVATVPAAHLLYRHVEEPARRAMNVLPERGGARMRVRDWWRGERVAAAGAMAGPSTAPLAAVGAEAAAAPGIPVDTDVARRDPATVCFAAVPPEPLAAEKAVELSGASWPARRPRPVAPEPEPIDNDTARRDPETEALPMVAATELPEPGTEAFPAVPGAPVEVPAQSGAVERVLAARNAEIRSPHPELAEQLVGAAGVKGRHRARNARPHAAPHIAGQRGPDRNGRSR